MYHNIKKPHAFFTHVFVYLMWFSKQIIFFLVQHLLVGLCVGMGCVLCEVRTEVLYITYIMVSFNLGLVMNQVVISRFLADSPLKFQNKF